MKLSELFNKPFKLKGGSTLNLKGFSKRVVDKEVGESNNSNGFTNALNQCLLNYPIYPHSQKLVNTNTAEIENIEDLSDNVDYKFLYKKLDINNLPSGILEYLISDYIFNDEQIIFSSGNINISTIYEIDGEEYVFLEMIQ